VRMSPRSQCRKKGAKSLQGIISSPYLEAIHSKVHLLLAGHPRCASVSTTGQLSLKLFSISPTESPWHFLTGNAPCTTTSGRDMGILGKLDLLMFTSASTGSQRCVPCAC